jgi:hypothetical protein
MSIAIVLFIAAIIVAFAAVLMHVAKNVEPGCSGDCNQGRLPCNCHLKDKK